MPTSPGNTVRGVYIIGRGNVIAGNEIRNNQDVVLVSWGQGSLIVR